MSTTDKIKSICAAIASHEDWYALQTYLLMTATPSEGITTLRDVINRINSIGEDTAVEFKKNKPSNKKEAPKMFHSDPDLDEEN
jgi:hypothetical protein|tara:strand:- start:47 stop:298 length:252 start_codon:yes stop_codon:yes gene_type:complete